MILFPEKYFEDEVRDGFYVNSIMKKCWAAQLEILSDIDRVCKRYGIKWYADCGTLLGAVRHGGFVPWDDDLDICMFRDDYYKFLAIASRELTNIWPNYKVLNYHNGGYWEPISRIINADDINFGVDRLEKFHGYPLSAGIDIFPLDFVCPDKEEEEARKQLFKTIFELADSDFAESIDQETLAVLSEAVGKKVDRNKSSKLQLYEWGEIVSSLYQREEAKEVCLMTFWYRHNDHKYPIELFDKTVMLPFENIEIQAPAGYDQVLKIEYGDYMKLVRTGGIHEYPHYEAQIDKVNEWLCETSPFNRSITKDSICNAYESYSPRNSRNAVLDNTLETVKLLFEAHEEIERLINETQFDEVLEMLSQCQDVAIQIGTYIEENLMEGFITVKYLEEYCEYVYQLSQDVINMKEADTSVLNKQLDMIKDSVCNDIGAVKEVVIFPFSADYWYILDKVWRKLNEDSMVKVVVAPIPYYEKSALGEVNNTYYDMEDYPDYVPLENYEDYDFENRRPDEIIIQYPYDNDNFVTAIDSRFYAENLKKYTDKLVYIPYFKTEEIGLGEERAYKVMDYYVLTPAVIYADKVMVQSEGIRELYVNKLVEFFGEETRRYWGKRIDGSAADLYEKNYKISKESIDMPDEWKKTIFKPDGSAKKIIIYYISISGLFEHKKKMIDKMQSVFDIFDSNSDEVTMIWRTDYLVESTIPTTDPELYDMYMKQVDKFKNASFGIYDDSGNDDRLIQLADAYYGDTDKLVQKCREKMIPVMIQNVDVI